MAQPPVPSTVKEVTIKPRLWGDAAVGAPGVGPTTPGAQKTQCLGVKKRRKMMRCIVFLMVLWTIICNIYIYIYFVYIYYIYIYIYMSSKVHDAKSWCFCFFFMYFWCAAKGDCLETNNATETTPSWFLLSSVFQPSFSLMFFSFRNEDLETALAVHLTPQQSLLSFFVWYTYSRERYENMRTKTPWDKYQV